MSENDIAGFFLNGWYVFDNFAPFQVEWRGKLYPTAEHAYQAAHFLATDPDFAERIRLARSPRQASSMANANAANEDPNWESKKLAIMEEIIRCKLAQHEYVQQILLSTGNKTIIETNDNDVYWGWGSDHNGQNQLGKIWMTLRAELQTK